MGELIRMDRTGHTVVARWQPDDPASVAVAQRALAEELEQGLLAILSTGEGQAEQVRELPMAGQVILRRPIAGG